MRKRGKDNRWGSVLRAWPPDIPGRGWVPIHGQSRYRTGAGNPIGSCGVKQRNPQEMPTLTGGVGQDMLKRF